MNNNNPRRQYAAEFKRNTGKKEYNEKNHDVKIFIGIGYFPIAKPHYKTAQLLKSLKSPKEKELHEQHGECFTFEQRHALQAIRFFADSMCQSKSPISNQFFFLKNIF